MNDKSIHIESFGDLHFIDKNPDNFLNRSTILYGPSNTGKSTIGFWIMELLKPYIPNIIVICPTDGANESYSGIVPGRCIFSSCDVEQLRNLYQRQEEATQTYNKANRMEILESLFNKANDSSAKTLVDKLDRITMFRLRKVESSSEMNYATKKEQTKAITDKVKKTKRSIYKDTIEKHKTTLLTLNLSTDEKFSIKFLRFNPNMLVVLDDCQAEIATWGKDDTVKKLFFQGRHVNVTSMYMLQTDSSKDGLPPGIRMNTFNNFFTDGNTATRFFNNKDNGFSAQDKRDAQKIISELFKPNPDGSPNFKKLVYSRLDPMHKFRYVIADQPENFKFGSEALWELSKKVPGAVKKVAVTKFSRSFTP